MKTLSVIIRDRYLKFLLKSVNIEHDCLYVIQVTLNWPFGQSEVALLTFLVWHTHFDQRGKWQLDASGKWYVIIGKWQVASIRFLLKSVKDFDGEE